MEISFTCIWRNHQLSTGIYIKNSFNYKWACYIPYEVQLTKHMQNSAENAQEHNTTFKRTNQEKEKKFLSVMYLT